MAQSLGIVAVNSAPPARAAQAAQCVTDSAQPASSFDQTLSTARQSAARQSAARQSAARQSDLHAHSAKKESTAAAAAKQAADAKKTAGGKAKPSRRHASNDGWAKAKTPTDAADSSRPAQDHPDDLHGNPDQQESEPGQHDRQQGSDGKRTTAVQADAALLAAQTAGQAQAVAGHGVSPSRSQQQTQDGAANDSRPAPPGGAVAASKVDAKPQANARDAAATASRGANGDASSHQGDGRPSAASDPAAAQAGQSSSTATQDATTGDATTKTDGSRKSRPGGSADAKAASASSQGADAATSAGAADDTGADVDALATLIVDAALAVAPDATGAGGPASSKAASHSSDSSIATTLLAEPVQNPPAKLDAAKVNAPAAPPPPSPPTEADFVRANHAGIVGGITAQLLPNGGSMQLQLHPHDLGTVHVNVDMRDGVMTTTFQTSSEQTSRLLSHTLGELKAALEGAGVSIGRLNVQQTPRDGGAKQGEGEQGRNGQGGEQSAAQQQEQQRREMLQKMWRRLSGQHDPLDLVA